eukprot:8390547-Alexandrium_andersonii.AAC.1
MMPPNCARCDKDGKCHLGDGIRYNTQAGAHDVYSTSCNADDTVCSYSIAKTATTTRRATPPRRA